MESIYYSNDLVWIIKWGIVYKYFESFGATTIDITVSKINKSVTVSLCKGHLKRSLKVWESTFNVKCTSMGKSKKSSQQI